MTRKITKYLVPAAVAAAAAVSVTPAHANARVSLPADPVAGGSLPLGLVAPTAPVHAIVALQHRDEAGLTAFIARVSDPGSPEYAKYLTPDQFEAEYAPSTATVSRVEAFLTAAGLKVDSVPRNRAYVHFTGTAAAAEKAFGAQIGSYRWKGNTVQAPVTALSVPSSLGGIVTGVTGLDTSDVVHPDISTPPGPPPAYINAKPCSNFFGEKQATDQPMGYGHTLPYVTCGYTPQQLRGAYGMAPAIAAGLDGAGQKVAIIDAYSSASIKTDAATWSMRRGIPAPVIDLHDTPDEEMAPEGVAVPTDIPVLGGANLQDPQGWAGEETLDVEAVHAMAPAATIEYQGATSPESVNLEMAQNNVVANKYANIVTNSYGGTSDTTDATSDGYWEQAAAQGMGVYFSAGDSSDETGGDGNTADRTVDGDGNSPYVTSVGGTTLAVNADDSYNFETYWGTYSDTITNGKLSEPLPGDYNSGGGGGTSEVYGQPPYQKGVVPDRFSRFWEKDKNKKANAIIPGRVTPDVAMLGDPNSGFLMGQVQDDTAYSNPDGATLPTDTVAYSDYRIGGTSLSSPLMAGVMALADQAQGKPHGFANPALYKAGADAFHDVKAPASTVAVVRVNYDNATNGSTTALVRTAGQTNTLSSIAGYDDSTGLGTPNGLAFLRALAPGSKKIPADPAASTGTTGGGSSTTTTTTAATPTTDTTTDAAAPAAPAGTTTPEPTPPATLTACTPPKKFVFVLHAPKGQRVVKAVLTVNGKTISHKGRKLTKITLTRPAGSVFTVVIKNTSNKGRIKLSRRTYTDSGCHVGATKVTHPKK